jgi:uncharacterized protein (TIGR04141 family)
MPEQLPYLYLNAFMAREEHNEKAYLDFLAQDAQVTQYPLDNALNIDGVLFVKKSQEKKPKWAGFAEQLTGAKLGEITNKSSSAVLLLKSHEQIFAFTFGYGRFLIDQRYFVSDFGIKTALNTLQHDSLRSVDLYTVQDQALQRKAQAVRASDIGVFGIDVSSDVLRAVTGTSRIDIGFRNISGGDAVYSFGINMATSDIPKIATQLASYYKLDHYKQDFLWVDNIRRLKDRAKTESLDEILVSAIRQKDHEAVAVSYNERAAFAHGYYLLDKKLVKSTRTTTAIELCDLLTSNREFVHVKHRKGGSAGLSHLFSQGTRE